MINMAECSAMRQAGASVGELAKRYNVTRRSIQRILKQCNLQVPRGRPDNGLNLFADINDEYSAYWLGFLMGDSCVSRNGNAIQISIIDREHLEKLRAWGRIPCEIKCVKQAHDNQRALYQIGIYSKRTITNCSRFGLVYDKNKRTIPDIKTDLMRHFWRGLWDADGHLSAGLAILTCKPVFIHGFRAWLATPGKGSDGYCGGLYHITSITSRSAYSGVYAAQVCKQLYTNHNISLDRKQWGASSNI